MPKTTTIPWQSVRGVVTEDDVKLLDGLIQVADEMHIAPEAFDRDDTDDRLRQAATMFDIAGAGVVGIVVKDSGADGGPEWVIAWRTVQ